MKREREIQVKTWNTLYERGRHPTAFPEELVSSRRPTRSSFEKAGRVQQYKVGMSVGSMRVDDVDPITSLVRFSGTIERPETLCDLARPATRRGFKV